MLNRYDMLKNDFLFIIGEFMRTCFEKNSELTPKMPENSAARLTKSYVDFYKSSYCGEFLEVGKAFLVNECGYSEYYFDEKLRLQGPKNDIEWCQIDVMDRSSPPDCREFYVHAADLEPIEDPDFHFYS